MQLWDIVGMVNLDWEHVGQLLSMSVISLDALANPRQFFLLAKAEE